MVGKGFSPKNTAGNRRTEVGGDLLVRTVRSRQLRSPGEPGTAVAVDGRNWHADVRCFHCPLVNL
jgi:hypothetical protein